MSSGMDRLRAAAKEVADRGRAGIDAGLDAARSADAARFARAETLARKAVARRVALVETNNARRDRMLAWVGGTAAGAVVGDGVRRVGRLTQRMPLLTAPMDLLQERHGVEALAAQVRQDPQDVLAAVRLGEALLAMEADVRLYDMARTVISIHGAVIREAMKTAATLGVGPAAAPATQMLSASQVLAAHRLRRNARDGDALHAIARARLAIGTPQDALQPAKLAVAAAGSDDDRGPALVTLARVYFALGKDASAENVARKAVDAGCSLGWQLLADLLYRARPGDAAGTPRHRQYVELRGRVRDEDRRAYHGMRPTAAEISRSALDAQLERARALRPPARPNADWQVPVLRDPAGGR